MNHHKYERSAIPYYYYPWYDIYHMYNAGNIPRQEYPEVDPTQFKESAAAFEELLDEASGILKQLSASEDFAYKVMDAAQKNEIENVKRLLKSTGVQRNMQVDFNPDGITMELRAEVQGSDCCHLTMDLRW